MKWFHALLTVLVGLGGIACRMHRETRTELSLVCTHVAPEEGDKQWPIYEDDAVKMVKVGYGDATRQSRPGFFVLRKAISDWIRVDRVPTRGATFGRSPTFEEVKAVGKAPPSIGWDFRGLAKEDYVDFPLTFAGFLFFPDQVELDRVTGEYVLRFNSNWDIEGVETILRLPADELTGRGFGASPGRDPSEAVLEEHRRHP